MKNIFWIGLHAVLVLSLALILTGASSERCYPVKVTRVIDGDTLDVIIPFFNTALVDRVRLEGIDTPELKEEKGQQVTDAVRTWFAASGQASFCSSAKRDKFGRWLGDFKTGISGAPSLVEFLKSNGFEKPIIEGSKKSAWWKRVTKKV